MNRQECDILNIIIEEKTANQRLLAEQTGYSLGTVNKAVQKLQAAGYLADGLIPTAAAGEVAEAAAPCSAVILAAGSGMRMAPINTLSPKAMLEVEGERLIERQIRQLREAGVADIYVVVGFMKETFEYLIDDFGVRLVVNREYASKNNLHSLVLVQDKLDDCYIVPGDVWCRFNPFRRREFYSWYMVTEEADEDSDVRVNRRQELVEAAEAGNRMIGIAYLKQAEAAALRDKLAQPNYLHRHEQDFWECLLRQKSEKKRLLPARVAAAGDVIEINTYEQLRDWDSGSVNLRSDAISVLTEVFDVPVEEIVNIEVLKKGMTNRSFVFCCRGQRYIMRIPGEGTDQLISRPQEAAVYAAIEGRRLCDDPVYLNPENGYKVTRFLEGIRSCDPTDDADLTQAMRLLRRFHDLELTVPHRFDIFEQIEFYESLWGDIPSSYRDYNRTKEKVWALKRVIEDSPRKFGLTHIDAVPDNFLFYREANGREGLQLTDWEYAGMQDPHVDIAMFAIYSGYDKKQLDHLIDLYFEGDCPNQIRLKIYCYVAACGLLWSNWCEYKRNLGVEFGEYSLAQYRYAKQFYQYVEEAGIPL
ncbi:MAG: phosphocholine cytidylyltransferase/choline kinase family protein [Lachnospiraceae bacterium]|nr:phosphocholine cytidylyltransferase/choline kinase family protein [Lachnospiraceae bacterium]MDY5742098.1 phosphocholine cytidylyltransferase/choline kinase family protein [Lachnospiraceae bacterium]